MKFQIYQEAEAKLKAGQEAEAFALLYAQTKLEPTSAKAWFELAGAFDFLGREAEALPHYAQAAALGLGTLPPEDHPRLYVQWGSTLRNLKKYDEANLVFEEGLRNFPGHAALLAFRGLTAYSEGAYRRAARLFLDAALAPGESLRDYARALSFYRDSLETFPARQRRWMRFRLHEASEISPLPGSKNASPSHAPLLARLMDAAYRGTIDHEGETEEQCLAEMEGTLSGKYGPFLGEASYIAFEHERAVAASLITLWKGEPLLAFSMTDPSHQGKGLAGGLIRQSLRALRAAGHHDLFLVVTEGNIPAEKLYRKLGFEDFGPAAPGKGAREKRDA